MFSRRGQPPSDDPSVATVEAILEAIASGSIGEPSRRDGRLVVTHAIWLCACETMDESPVWLIYAVGDDGIGWQRIPAGMEERDVVEAEHLTGGHPAPEGVLEWLRGDSSDPWRGRGDYPEDAFVYEELRQRILSAQHPSHRMMRPLSTPLIGTTDRRHHADVRARDHATEGGRTCGCREAGTGN